MSPCGFPCRRTTLLAWPEGLPGPGDGPKWWYKSAGYVPVLVVEMCLSISSSVSSIHVVLLADESMRRVFGIFEDPGALKCAGSPAFKDLKRG